MEESILTDANVESLIDFIDADASPGAARRQAALRHILTAVGVQAQQIARLQRALRVDDIAMQEINRLAQGDPIAERLRQTAGPAIDAAIVSHSLASIEQLEHELAQAETTRETLLSLGRFALTIAAIVAK